MGGLCCASKKRGGDVIIQNKDNPELCADRYRYRCNDNDNDNGKINYTDQPKNNITNKITNNIASLNDNSEINYTYEYQPTNNITSLIRDEQWLRNSEEEGGDEMQMQMQIQACDKWFDTICASNGMLYGIPWSGHNRRVVKIDPKAMMSSIHTRTRTGINTSNTDTDTDTDVSRTFIGPHLNLHGNGIWMKGTEDGMGCIYCLPKWSNHSGRTTSRVLKIDTHTDTVSILSVILPERVAGGGGGGSAGSTSTRGNMWGKGALATDGNIYYMPKCAKRILKLHPPTGTFESVGERVGMTKSQSAAADGSERQRLLRGKFSGTVAGNDGCIYGIPDVDSIRIIKYDPARDATSTVGRMNSWFECGNGALGRDGNIYAANCMGQVLKINTATNSWSWKGKKRRKVRVEGGWGDAILGRDGCVYWPPCNVHRTLKYEVDAERTSLVGHDYGYDVVHKWSGGALAPDGAIYCLPMNSRSYQVLAIDPLRDFTEAFKTKMEKHPGEFGYLFHATRTSSRIGTKKKELQLQQSKLQGEVQATIPTTNSDPASAMQTNFDCAVEKYGVEKVFQIIEEFIPPTNELIAVNNLYPFLILASSQSLSPSVMTRMSLMTLLYRMIRQDPSFANDFIHSSISK